MTTQTEHLGLKRHTTADVYRIQDYADNWAKLDASPGVFVCDSTTRPTNWTVAQTGMLISERDSGLVWRWTGTKFVRVASKGFLGQAERWSDLQATGTSFVTLLSQTVTIPPSWNLGVFDAAAEGPGIRRVLINVTCPRMISTMRITEMAIYRGSTALTSWYAKGGNGTLAQDPDDYPSNESIAITDWPTTSGSHTYSLRFRPVPGIGGISTAQAADGRPIYLTVIEV